MIGENATPAILKRDDLDESMRKLEFLNETIPEKKTNIAEMRKQYIETFNGTSKNTCLKPVDEPMPESAPLDDDASAKAFYDQLNKNCKDLAGALGDQIMYRYFEMMRADFKANYEQVTKELSERERRAVDIAAAKQATKLKLEAKETI